MSGRQRLAAALLVGALLGPATSGAQTDELRATAARVAGMGQRLYDSGRYAEALDRFQEAQRVYPSADLQVYIAASLLSLQRDHEAVGALLEFFPEAGVSTDALRLLALRVWEESSPKARRDLVGDNGARIGEEVRRRLAAADPRHLPAELRGLIRARTAAASPTAVTPQKPTAPAKPHPLATARWPALTLGGLGLVALGGGAALLALEGRCATPGDVNTCAEIYSTQSGGAALVAVGSAALFGGGAWLLTVSLRRSRHR